MNSLNNLIVIGTQWGDEGKGKVVDLLCKNADLVIRFQGGHNAGHTLVIGKKEFKLSLLPSGIIQPKKLSIVSSGVIVDPLHLLVEIENITKQGVKISPKNLIISENCFLILPIHRYVDNLREINSSNNKIGTTGRGIGPAYEDKVGRRGLKISDLKSKNYFKKRFIEIYDYHNVWIEAYKNKKIDYKKDFEDISLTLNKLENFFNNTWKKISEYKKLNRKILYEGAQGTFLDLDFGTYPYVTSSNTIAGNATVGSGVGPSNNFYVLGITKAYTTRVGYGPFPTEDSSQLGKKLGEIGKEFGTVTGRKRRCGWLDLIILKQSIILSGISGVVITKLDVLDTFREIKVCIAYELDGKKIDYFPSNLSQQQKLKPIYKIFDGWEKSTYGITNYEELPPNAKMFVKKIESIIKCNIDMVSTGPDRSHTIFLNNIFKL